MLDQFICNQIDHYREVANKFNKSIYIVKLLNRNDPQAMLRNSTYVVLALIASPACYSDDNLQRISAFSPDIYLDGSVEIIAKRQAAHKSGSGYGFVELGAIPSTANVDALHGLPDGTVLFSLDASTILSGEIYHPEDLIYFDGLTWSTALDGSSVGIPPGANLDALAVLNGIMLFSLDVTVEFDDVIFDDADIIAVDGMAISKFFDASATGIERPADTDALHVTDQGSLLISLDNSGALKGVFYTDEDVLMWDSVKWSVAYVGSSESPGWQSADLDSWSFVYINDVLFDNGFE